MGDARFNAFLGRVLSAADRRAAISDLKDDEVIQALAAASRGGGDPYIANILATEAMNRLQVKTTIVESAGQGLLSLDAEGFITHANPVAASLLGYEAWQMIRLDFHEVFCRGNHGRPTCPAILSATSGGRRAISDDTFSKLEGAALPVDWTASEILREGEPGGAVVAFRDISERLLATSRLREERRIQRTLLDAQDRMDEGVILLSDDRIVHVNEAFVRITGHGREGLRTLDDLRALVHPSQPGASGLDLLRLPGAGRPRARFDLPLLHADGQRVELEVALQSAAEGGDPFSVLIVRDVTMRRALEASLRSSERAFRDGFEEATVALAWFTLDGHCCRANGRAAELLPGLRRGAALARAFAQEALPELDEAFRELREGRAMCARLEVESRAGPRVSLELGLVMNDEGEPAWVTASAATL